jgi:hypothetical protein
VLHRKFTLSAHWLTCAGSVIHDDDEDRLCMAAARERKPGNLPDKFYHTTFICIITS